MVILLTLLLVGVAMWGQYWYDRAHRLMDAMQYMIEEDIEDVDQRKSSHDDREEEIDE